MKFITISLICCSALLYTSCGEKSEQKPGIDAAKQPNKKPAAPHEPKASSEKDKKKNDKDKGSQAKNPKAFSPASTTELFKAIKASDTAKVKDLLDKQADPNGVEENSSYRPLHWAALQKDSALTKELLAKGAKVDEKTTTGLTPLMLASFLGADKKRKRANKSRS